MPLSSLTHKVDFYQRVIQWCVTQSWVSPEWMTEDTTYKSLWNALTELSVLPSAIYHSILWSLHMAMGVLPMVDGETETDWSKVLIWVYKYKGQIGCYRCRCLGFWHSFVCVVNDHVVVILFTGHLAAPWRASCSLLLCWENLKFRDAPCLLCLLGPMALVFNDPSPVISFQQRLSYTSGFLLSPYIKMSALVLHTAWETMDHGDNLTRSEWYSHHPSRVLLGLFRKTLDMTWGLLHKENRSVRGQQDKGKRTKVDKGVNFAWRYQSAISCWVRKENILGSCGENVFSL